MTGVPLLTLDTARRRATRAARGVALLLLVSCTEQDGTTGLPSALLDAVDITITSVDPDTATVDTTITVRITGTGFSDDVTATWLVDTTAATGIHTLSTTVKSTTELEAIIDISADAPLRSYSVRVRSGKKKKQGIAVEKFRIVAKPIALPELGQSSVAYDINDRGVIVGGASDGSETGMAVRWTPVDTGWSYTILGDGTATAINNSGQIVRVHNDALARSWRSWIHLPSGTVVDLGAVYVRDISDSGVLIGTIVDASRKDIAVTWTPLSPTQWGQPEPLPLPSGFSSAQAIDINANGDIVGIVSSPTASLGAVWRYRNQQWLSPEFVDSTIESSAVVINDMGALAGWMFPCIRGLPNCYTSPVWWSGPGGNRRTLPTLYNSRGWANGINNANFVVGSAPVHYNDGSGALAALVWHAVVWFPSSQWPEDLGAISPSHGGEAYAINSGGWVVGYMHNYTLARHAMLWKLPPTLTVGTPLARRR